MVAPRRKDLIRRRRRIEDEGEEEEGSTGAAPEDDSLSEGSVISDADDDADGEGSDASDTATPERRDGNQKNGVKSYSGKHGGSEQIAPSASTKPQLSTIMSDTEAMMNGLKFSGEVDEDDGIDFEDMGKEPEGFSQEMQPAREAKVMAPSNSMADRRRREHEDYIKKRDADPTFVPNRGGFFMHDHRSAAPGQNGFRPFGRGRGRGRGAGTGPISPTR